MATVTELVTKFDFQGSIKPLLEYNSALGASIGILGAFAAAVQAQAGLFFWWADGQLKAADSLDALSNRTGVAVERIQELRYVAGQTQSSAEALDASLSGLANTIADASLSGNETLARLGLSVRDTNGHLKTADQLLGEVGGRMRALGLTVQQQESFAQALGIDASLVRMLGLAGSEMDALRRRARQWGVLSKEQTQQAAQYAAAMSDLRFGLSAVKQMIAIGVGPELQTLVTRFSDLLAANRDWIINGAAVVIEFVGEMLAAINRLTPVIIGMIGLFLAWKLSAVGLAAVLGVVFSPVVLITAAIVALLVIIDDLIVAFQGGQSVIADFFQEFLGVDIVPILRNIVEWAGKAVDIITSFFSILWDIHMLMLGGMWDGLKAVAEWFGLVDSEPTINHETIFPTGNSGADVPGAPNDNRQVNQQVEMTIYASDPDRAAAAMQDGLQRQLENARTQFGPGGY